MLITKKRHEAETEHLRDEISRLRGARMMDAETIRQQSAELEMRRSEYASLRRDYDTRGDLIAAARRERDQAEKDIEAQSDEINRLLVQLEDSQQIIVDLNEIIYELRPDAEKWRDRAAREKQRGESRKKARA